MDFIKLTDAGLVIAPRNEIYKQLVLFAKAAYGDDISLDEGTSFNAFLQMMADSLSTLNGSVQSFSELMSTKELSGTFLDFIAGQRGIVRKTKSDQKVLMTATVGSEIIKPFLAPRNTIFVLDNEGRTWVNTTQLFIHPYKFLPDGAFDTVENFQGTCEFGLTSLTNYNTDLFYAYNFSTLILMHAIAPSDAQFIDHITFINHMNAVPAVANTETDAQFRARYDQMAYSNAMSTVEGLKANLLKFSSYVRVVENLTNSSLFSSSNPYTLDAHSIWCIVDGGSTATNWKFTIVTTALADASAFDVAGILVGDFIKVGTAGINIMSSTARLLNSIWERTATSELTVRSADYIISKDASDISIAQTILNYKSLGCGVSVSLSVPNGTMIGPDDETLNTGNFMVEFPVETMIVQIPFTRLINNAVTFEVTLKAFGSLVLDGDLKNVIKERVSYALQQFVSSLMPGDIITQAAVIAVINSILSEYGNGKFDFVSDTPIYAYAHDSGIQIYERATGGSATVVFDDEVI